MTENIGSGTAQGAVDYLTSLVEKGRSRSGVVSPLKIALTKILEKTEGPDWPRVDVVKLDVDDVITRFKNLTLGTYTDASYRAYELRMKRSISWYRQFLANPGWFPKESSRSVTAESKKLLQASVGTVEGAGIGVGYELSSPKASRVSDVITDFGMMYEQLPKAESISYPFPLQSGEMARIYMPKSVTKSDIMRLSIFLEALVIEEGGHEKSL
jgi:hypothetical protein